MTEILKYTIPALVVFASSYFIVTRFLANEADKRKSELQKGKQKIAFPTRMRAYERLTLLLERVEPDNLLPRLLKAEMPAQNFQALLIKTIRDEYEHNLSQQIYVSDEAWNTIVTAKETLIKIVNMAAATLTAENGAIDLSKQLLEAYGKMKETPTGVAMKLLKQEARSILY